MHADIRLVPRFLFAERELLSDQWQHCSIGKVKQHNADSKGQERSATEQHGKAQGGVRVARSLWCLVLLSIIEPARKIVINGAPWNRKDAQQARDRHSCQQIEHHRRPPKIRCSAGHRCGALVAGVVERLVSSDSFGEGLVTENAETDGAERGRKHRAGRVGGCLRNRNRYEIRQPWKSQ
jgi:hypothetical protein